MFSYVTYVVKKIMKKNFVQNFVLLFCFLLISNEVLYAQKGEIMKNTLWKCIFFKVPVPKDVDDFNKFISKTLAPSGINVLMLETTLKYKFDKRLSKPTYLNKIQARSIANTCRNNGIRLIPILQCVGHQSWGTSISALLEVYPEFDETPDKYPDNKGIYSRSWCPLHPDINKVVFKMMDEIIDAYQADALHVGMDEILIIADPDCPRCSGKDPAKIFAKAINDFHSHIVGKHAIEMMMWGDRLNDPKIADYGKTRSSHNGTAPAIDMIPKDIIFCDWYYGVRKNYKSLNVFQNKGFRVIPTGFYQIDGNRTFLNYSRIDMTPRMLGFMFTTWGMSFRDLEKAIKNPDSRSLLPETVGKLAQSMEECIPLIKPAPRISIDVPDTTENSMPARTVFLNKPTSVNVSVFPESSYCAPIKSITGELFLESLDGKKIKRIGKLPSITDFSKSFTIKPLAGEYQITACGNAHFTDMPNQEFKLIGPSFKVVDKASLNNPVNLRIMKSGISFEELISWMNIFPKSGRKLASVSPKKMCAAEIKTKGDYWVTGGYPADDPEVFVISAPGKTKTKKFNFAQVTFNLPVPKSNKKKELQFFLIDEYFNEKWTGYRFYELLYDGKIIWEEDVALKRDGQNAWSTIDVTDIVNGKKNLKLTFRLRDRKSSNDLQSTTLIGSVRLVENLK